MGPFVTFYDSEDVARVRLPFAKRTTLGALLWHEDTFNEFDAHFTIHREWNFEGNIESQMPIITNEPFSIENLNVSVYPSIVTDEIHPIQFTLNPETAGTIEGSSIVFTETGLVTLTASHVDAGIQTFEYEVIERPVTMSVMNRTSGGLHEGVTATRVPRWITLRHDSPVALEMNLRVLDAAGTPLPNGLIESIYEVDGKRVVDSLIEGLIVQPGQYSFQIVINAELSSAIIECELCGPNGTVARENTVLLYNIPAVSVHSNFSLDRVDYLNALELNTELILDIEFQLSTANRTSLLARLKDYSMLLVLSVFRNDTLEGSLERCVLLRELGIQSPHLSHAFAKPLSVILERHPNIDSFDLSVKLIEETDGHTITHCQNKTNRVRLTLPRPPYLGIEGSDLNTGLWLRILRTPTTDISEQFPSVVDRVRMKTPSHFNHMILRRNLFRRIAHVAGEMPPFSDGVLDFETLFGDGLGFQFRSIQESVSELIGEKISYQQVWKLWRSYGRSRFPRFVELSNENRCITVAPRAQIKVADVRDIPTWLLYGSNFQTDWNDVLVPDRNGLFIFDQTRNPEISEPLNEEECCKSFWFAHKDSTMSCDDREILLAPAVQGIYYLEALGEIFEIEVIE